MFHFNYTDHETVSTPLPQVASKFSKNSANSRRSSDKKAEAFDEEINLPKFMNLKFKNIFLKEKQSIEPNEKTVIFSKLNLRNFEEKKEEHKEIQPLRSEIKYVDKATSTSEHINYNNYHLSKNLLHSNIPVSSMATTLKKDQFKTTIDYYKYLIEKNESNRRLHTNFMVKDHFLIFSKKMKAIKEEIKIAKLDQCEHIKNIQQNLTQVKKIKSKSSIPDLKINNMKLNVNLQNTSSRFVILNNKIINTNKEKDLNNKNSFKANSTNDSKSDYGIFKQKVKKIFALKNKQFKLKFIEAEINLPNQKL